MPLEWKQHHSILSRLHSLSASSRGAIPLVPAFRVIDRDYPLAAGSIFSGYHHRMHQVLSPLCATATIATKLSGLFPRPYGYAVPEIWDAVLNITVAVIKSYSPTPNPFAVDALVPCSPIFWGPSGVPMPVIGSKSPS